MKHQINANLITRLIGTAVVIGFAGSSFAAAPFTETRSAVVKFADLNLDTPQGVAVLYKRIHGAAEQVCETSSEDREFLEVAARSQKVHGRQRGSGGQLHTQCRARCVLLKEDGPPDADAGFQSDEVIGGGYAPQTASGHLA